MGTLFLWFGHIFQSRIVRDYLWLLAQTTELLKKRQNIAISRKKVHTYLGNRTHGPSRTQKLAFLLSKVAENSSKTDDVTMAS